MSNRIQIRRSTTPGNVPLLTQLLEGEFALNMPDKKLYLSNGTEVVQINHAANIETDAGHRFLTDAQIQELYAVASATVTGNVKIGDNINVDAEGVISLKIASTTDNGVLSSADWNTFNGKQNALGYTPINQAGDTMLGALVLNGAPQADNEASNKKYVDDGLATKLSKSGGTMIGDLILASDPTQNLGAASKQYVDTSVNNISGKYAAPVQAIVDLSSIAPAYREDKQMRLVEDTGAIYRFDAQSVVAADGDGVIMPDDNPANGRWLKVQAATQNHENLFGLQGGANGDHLHLTTAEKNSYDAHLGDTSLHLTAAQNTWIDAINASSNEVNFLIGVTSSIQNQLDSKQVNLGYTPVNVAGDTMQGMLSLYADPTQAMHAVTKQYAESMTIDGGTF